MNKITNKPGKGSGKKTKISLFPKTNQNPQQSIVPSEVEQGMAGNNEGVSQPQVNEVIQSPSETSVKGQESDLSKKTIRGFADGIMYKFGYVRETVVTSYLTDFLKTIKDEEMSSEEFAKLSLKEQFDSIAKRINEILTSQADDIQSEKNKNELLQTEVQELKELQSKNDTLQQEKEGLIQKVSFLKMQLSSKDSEIQTLKANISTLQSETGKYQFALETLLKRKVSVNTLESEIILFKESYSKLIQSKEAYEELKRNFQRIEAELSNLKSKHNQLEKTHHELETQYGKLKTDYEALERSYKELEDTYRVCKERCDELDTSEVGQLEAIINENKATIAELTAAKNDVEATLVALQKAKGLVDDELNGIKESLASTEDLLQKTKADLVTEKESVATCNRIIKAKENEISALTIQAQADTAKIEEQTQEIELQQGIIKEKTEEIHNLNTKRQELLGQINTLNAKIDSLENEKIQLINDKVEAEKQTKEKSDFIFAERDDYAKAVIALAERLSEVAAKDFLGCCDEAFETNRINLQEKVAKPVRALMRELADIEPGKFASQKQLEDAYYAVIKEQFDTTSGLTRIAQWYAYSCVPFMLDQDRDDGLFVRQSEVKSMFSLATKLLGMVGVEYHLPNLFVEHLSEDNTYDDVTGKRQLNIEYMCPTARRHKENIDCIDNSSIIIDVVEVGYCDNRGNFKKSQVII